MRKAVTYAIFVSLDEAVDKYRRACRWLVREDLVSIKSRLRRHALPVVVLAGNNTSDVCAVAASVGRVIIRCDRSNGPVYRPG